MSPATNARKVGVAAPPLVGPASTLLATWVNSAGVKVPAVVIGDPPTVVLNMIPSPVIATLVTVPAPLVDTYAETLPLPSTCQSTLVAPPGAAGVVLLKLANALVTLFIFTTDPEADTAASIRIMFSANTSSIPHVANPRFGVTCSSPPGYINDM